MQPTHWARNSELQLCDEVINGAIGAEAGLNTEALQRSQGCLKVNSGAVFRDLNTAQREHSLDVVGQRAQTAAN